jgi:3-deoxy-D-arabino-heptulosonate 7-phosphate (DAHP) synthase
MTGTPPCPPDNIDCTIDCNEANNTCPYTPDHTLCPGQVCSITEGCIDWPTTEELIRETHRALAPRFA